MAAIRDNRNGAADYGDGDAHSGSRRPPSPGGWRGNSRPVNPSLAIDFLLSDLRVDHHWVHHRRNARQGNWIAVDWLARHRRSVGSWGCAAAGGRLENRRRRDSFPLSSVVCALVDSGRTVAVARKRGRSDCRLLIIMPLRLDGFSRVAVGAPHKLARPRIGTTPWSPSRHPRALSAKGPHTRSDADRF